MLKGRKETERGMKMRKIKLLIAAVIVLAITASMVIDIAHAEEAKTYPEETVYIARETIAEYNDYLGYLTVSRFTRSDGSFDYRMYYYSGTETFHFCLPEDLEKVMTIFDNYRTKLSDGQRKDVRAYTLSRLRRKGIMLFKDNGDVEHVIDKRWED